MTIAEQKTCMTDDTMRMTREYPVVHVLGQYYLFWAGETSSAPHPIQFLNSSPPQNSYAETLLVTILTLSARQNRWVGFDMDWRESHLLSFNEERKRGHLDMYGLGIHSAISKDLVDLSLIEGRVYIVPKQRFVEFTAKHVESYSQEQTIAVAEDFVGLDLKQ